MKKLYFVLTHYDADRAVRFNVRLLAEYAQTFYRHGYEPHVAVFTSGTTLEAGRDEELLTALPNLGHADSDIEMTNVGIALALGRGADLLVKLSGSRIFFNPEKLIDLVRVLDLSNKGMLGDYWNPLQYASDVLFMKSSFARRIFPLPIRNGKFESKLLNKVKDLALQDEVLLYEDRQPIHHEDGTRRTNFYDRLELLTNTEHDLEPFIRQHYPEYEPLLQEDRPTTAPSTLNWLNRLRPRTNPRLALTRTGDDFELRDPKNRKLSVLNKSAALVWSLCEGNRYVVDIGAVIESELELDPGAALDSVRRTIARFLAEGLVEI